MKYIKTFEKEILMYDLNVGDYVIADVIYKDEYEDLEEFINHNIGKIYKIDSYTENKVYVCYYNIPEKLKVYKGLIDGDTLGDTLYITISLKYILHHAKNKEDLEALINQEKYNL